MTRSQARFLLQMRLDAVKALGIDVGVEITDPVMEGVIDEMLAFDYDKSLTQAQYYQDNPVVDLRMLTEELN